MADGSPATADFIAFWAASRMALAGHAAAIYDPAALKAAEVLALGHDFAGSLGWYYPPTFLAAAWPLSLLPPVPAQLAWTALTLALFALTLARIGGRDGLLLAFACPAGLATVMAGQNGFLTAALLGGALLALDRRPILAGLLIAGLSYKPHFGLLIPLALAAGGHGRALGAAAIGTLALAAVTALAFGAEVWIAFLGSLGGTQEAMLAQGLTGFDKLQSLFGVLRQAGLGLKPALAAQTVLTGALALGLAWLWRRETRAEVKAAALSLAVVLATPYLFLYDLVLLALPMAFLSRTRLDGADLALAAAALLALFVYPFAGAPSGFAASLLVGMMVLRRCRAPEAASHPLAGTRANPVNVS